MDQCQDSLAHVKPWVQCPAQKNTYVHTDGNTQGNNQGKQHGPWGKSTWHTSLLDFQGPWWKKRTNSHIHSCVSRHRRTHTHTILINIYILIKIIGKI